MKYLEPHSSVNHVYSANIVLIFNFSFRMTIYHLGRVYKRCFVFKICYLCEDAYRYTFYHVLLYSYYTPIVWIEESGVFESKC